MPGTYNSEERLITLNTEIETEPLLTKAMLIHGVVADLLFQSGFPHAAGPELIDMAVVGTGLGVLQSKIEFVKQTGAYWDTAQWLAVSRPFLDCRSLAYVFALAAWVRDDNKPIWSKELRNDVKKPMEKSLKYLFSSSDSFFCANNISDANSPRTQREWITLAENNPGSRHLIAIRHLEDPNEKLLLAGLRVHDREQILHSVNAIDRASNENQVNDEVVEELRILAGHRDNEIRAKSICVLTRLGKLDATSIDLAGQMLQSNVRFVLFAGLFALSSLDSVPESIIPHANRGFVGALNSCDYEFVNLFASAFNRWLDKPEEHFETLLVNNSPEYFEIAIEALGKAREKLVSLGKAS